MSRHPARRNARPPRVIAVLAALAFGLVGALVPAASATAAVDVTFTVVDQVGVPAAGVAVEINKSGVDYRDDLSTDVNGEFTIPALDDGSYEVFIPYNSSGTGGERFHVGQRLFTVTAGAVSDLSPIVVARYVTVTGTITNWSPLMGDVAVDLFINQSGLQWEQVNINPHAVDVSTDGTFSISSPIFADEYTLRFMPESYASPYPISYLGGAADPESATHLTGVPGVGMSGITMTMPDAARITGRVTSGGNPVPGITVWAQDDPDYVEYAEAVTDANGDYTLYVRPGLTYVVSAEDWDNDAYEPMTYDGRCGCGNDFDPVVPTLADPAEGIDFDLVARDPEWVVAGFVADLDSDVLADQEVRIFQNVGSAWVLVDTYVSDDGSGITSPFNFIFDLAESDDYRIQVADSSGRILQIVDGGTSPDLNAVDLFDPLPACYGDIPPFTGLTLAFMLVDPATATGACATLGSLTPTTPGGSGSSGGSGSTGGAKTGGQRSDTGVEVTPTPTPTPTAAPTPSATPQPSASPTPSADPVEPSPASAPDLSWLVWGILGVVVVVVVGGVVFFIRRR